MRKLIHFASILLFSLLIACNTDSVIETNEAGPSINTESGEGLKDVSSFPVGNIWASGHPTWGNSKGTDLGGPNNQWTASAFGALSTIVQKQLQLPLEDELFLQEFNSITPEVALKPHNISINPDSIDFSEADAMMAYAEANNLRVHGHVLVFDKSVPEWALAYEKNDVWTEQQWENWLEDYITKVVSRYRGRIVAWDVVNEAGAPLGGGLNTDYFWYKTIGPDFLEKAFRWANAADPEAKLFINEFGMEFLPVKLRDLITIADNLRAQGIRVDGIGFQGHIPLPVIMGDYSDLKRAFKKVADAGYLVHLSELDLPVNVLGYSNSQTALQHRIQRKKYNDVARAYLDGVPPAQQWGITLWGIPDHHSFYNTVKIWFDLRLLGGDKDFPLLWDDNYEVKPAYYGFRNGLKDIEEGWLYPNIYSTQKAAVQLNEKERKEMETYLNASKEFMINYLGLSSSEVDEMIKMARESLSEEGLSW
ncbi:MAG: endo-1,4-beta-xylanase [Chitinophagales bacterium]